MPTWVVTLDTTAPEITWGAVVGAAYTETLEVGYTINEPEVVSAELELADNRRIPMTITPTRLMVVVPDDAPEGWGRVLAHVSDEVANTATRELPVYISGIAAPPPLPGAPVSGGGLPAAAYGVKDFGVSVARARDSFTVRVAVSSTSSVRLRYSTPAPRRRTFTDRLQVASSYTTGVRATGPRSAARPSSYDHVIRRGEGPDALEELILLDLL